MPAPGVRLCAVLLLPALLLLGCSEPWLTVKQVPENGYGQTINYQFQAQVHVDSDGNCEMMVVSVRPLSKLYTREEPPARLRLFDDDCHSPLRFERAQYVSKQTGEQVRLSGPEVNYFLGQYVRMEGELVGWLWREGII